MYYLFKLADVSMGPYIFQGFCLMDFFTLISAANYFCVVTLGVKDSLFTTGIPNQSNHWGNLTIFLASGDQLINDVN